MTLHRQAQRLVHTLRHLRPVQLTNRLTRRLGSGPTELRPPPPVRPGVAPATPYIEKPDSRDGDGTFTFLNVPHRVPPGKLGAPEAPSLLWEYNLHYFDGLHSRGREPSVDLGWLEAWMAEVPVGERPAWDPYPTSRRITNWVKWARREGRCPPGLEASLATQAEALSGGLEYHLLANHLLANAVALVAVGSYFGGDDGDRWLRAGTRLLMEQLQEQFLPGGAHYERSPSYHLVVTEDLLDVVNLLRVAGLPVPRLLESTVQRALGWVPTVLRSDGRVPLFNDAAYDASATPAQVEAYGARLGLSAEAGEPARGLRFHAAPGLMRYQRGRLFVVAELADVIPPYQPGHTHCGMGSFELCWDAAPIVVDTGTSTYERGPRRDLERGTAAHNTVQLGQREQSEIWAAFRMGRRASVRSARVEGDALHGRIRAFPGAWSTLDRSWLFDGEEVTIRDRVVDRPASAGQATARLHFHPDVTLAETGDGGWSANGLTLAFDGARAVRSVAYEYAPEFNRRLPGRCLEIDFDRQLLTVIRP